MKRLHRRWRARSTGRIELILDGLGTPANVGSIIRSAAAYRVDRLWLAGPTPPIEHPGVRRTSLGTERYLEITPVAETSDAITACAAGGLTVVALELTDDAEPLHELATRLGPDVCLVVGHEDHGVSKAALAAVTHVAMLPQLGKVGSLNVATAAAIAIYELRRGSWTAADAPVDAAPAPDTPDRRGPAR